MRNRVYYKPALGCLVVLLLLFTSAVQTSMNESRVEMKLTRVTPLENAPPALVFTTVALGGFRGLISNILWIRANKLQQESKYFEMVQLADWITRLQPHFSQVWRIQAWNMTYNISIKFPNKDDKWHWIMAGVKLLRDEGIRYNPHNPALYEELCYFFYHKMGGTSDLAHLNFKNRWAWMWHNILNLHDIRLIPEGGLEDLPESGANTLIILRTDKGLHFRVFDGAGLMTLDKPEKEFSGHTDELIQLKAHLAELWEQSNITAARKTDVLSLVTLITRLALQNGNGFPDYGALVAYEPRLLTLSAGDLLPRVGFNELCIVRASDDADNVDISFRVFNGKGEKALDLPAAELRGKDVELAEFLALLEPLWDRKKLKRAEERQIIDQASVLLERVVTIEPQTRAAIEAERTIREENKMDVRLMKTVDDDYGPLDWRMPETHAIYWAMDGMRMAHTKKVLPLRRIIYQSMQLASRRGKVIENKALKKLEFGPNVRIIPKANATYLQMKEEDPEREEHISQGHRNFLLRAVRDLYLNAQREDAIKWFEYAQEVFPDFVLHEGDDIDTFVLYYLAEDIEALNPNDFRNMIKGFIQTAYYDMARGEGDGFRGRMATAKMVRDKYQYWIDKPGLKNIQGGRALPSLYDIETEVLKELFDPASNIYPELLAVWETMVPNLDERIGRTEEGEETEAGEKADSPSGPAAENAASNVER